LAVAQVRLPMQEQEIVIKDSTAAQAVAAAAV
jgi:hypothetical protein